ncbi:MAG: hypothetical protein K2W95_06765 [Candidatus Obscuribacterales bacterium]|nr:hypothetical protein [Candidatus Obscuribacterales bacterium]
MRLLGNRASCRTAASITLALTISIGIAAPGMAEAEFIAVGQGTLAPSSTRDTTAPHSAKVSTGSPQTDRVYVAEVPGPQMITGPVIPAGNVNFQAPLSPALSVGSNGSAATAPPTQAAPKPSVVTTSFHTPPAPPLAESNSAPIPGGVSVISTAVVAPPAPGTDAVPKPSDSVAFAVTTGPDKPNEFGIIVIDMDTENAPKTSKDTLVWKEIPDAPGKTSITTGVEFPISVVSMISSKTAKVGDRVEARTKVDLKIGGRMIAPKGSKVIGHVTAAHPARRLLIAELKLKRWMRANGAVGLQFDEILTNEGDHLPLVAIPARHPRIVHNKNEGRILGVNHQGQIASPLSIQLKHQGVHLAVRGAAACGGVFTMGAVPVIFGVAGAIDPSFAFMHPVGKNVKHRRLKGFGMGVVSGLPGGFIIADYMIKGVEAQIKPGDEFLVSFKQDFTGEKATEAQLHGATTKVHGEVLNKKQKKSKSK